MRILKEDASSGNVKVQIETDEDLWHLYNVIEEGDLVSLRTVEEARIWRLTNSVPRGLRRRR